MGTIHCVVAADFRQAKRSASGDHSRITLLSEYWEWAADNLKTAVSSFLASALMSPAPIHPKELPSADMQAVVRLPRDDTGHLSI